MINFWNLFYLKYVFTFDSKKMKTLYKTSTIGSMSSIKKFTTLLDGNKHKDNDKERKRAWKTIEKERKHFSTDQ